MIVFMTCGRIDVEVNGRSISLQGEALLRTGEGSPDFVVYKAMVKTWKDGGAVTEEDMDAIVADVLASAEQRGVVIEFE
jgi:immunity protein 74 of polymorphic toxin system